jgi:thymidine phosphorylase
MGAGRRSKADPIDPGVGIIFHRKLGSKVNKGDVIGEAFIRTEDALSAEGWEKKFRGLWTITPQRKPVPKLVLEVLQ